AGVGHDGEQQQHGDAGKDARGHQLSHGVYAQGAHGVNLFGDDHGTQLAGDRGCIAAGDHDSSKDGAKLADHGDADELSGDGGGAEGRKSGRGLKGKHAPGKEPRQDDNRNRTEADNVGLNEEIGPVDGGAEEIEQRLPDKQGVLLDREHDLFGGTVDRVERHARPAYELLYFSMEG